jgi:hypothetical protein
MSVGDRASPSLKELTKDHPRPTTRVTERRDLAFSIAPRAAGVPFEHYDLPGLRREGDIHFVRDFKGGSETPTAISSLRANDDETRIYREFTLEG